MHRMPQFFLAIIAIAFAIIFGAPAHADTITIPSLGVNVAVNANCEAQVVGHISARKAGELVEHLARAEAICKEAKAENTTRDAEAVAVEALAAPIKDGGDVSYRRKGDSTSFATGNAARTHTLTEFAQNDPRMGFGGVLPLGRGDPNLAIARMQGMQMGYTSLFADDVQAMPAAPAAAPAQCGATPAECQEAVDAMRRVLDARKGS